MLFKSVHASAVFGVPRSYCCYNGNHAAGSRPIGQYIGQTKL